MAQRAVGAEVGLRDDEHTLLEFIRAYGQRKGYPPTIREMAGALGVATGTVHSGLLHLSALGLIRREPTRPRSIEVLVDQVERPDTPFGRARHIPLFVTDADAGAAPRTCQVKESIPIPEAMVDDAKAFAVRAPAGTLPRGVFPGDLLVVSPAKRANEGDTIIVQIGPGSIAVMELPRRRSRSGDAEVSDVVGRVVAVMRRL
jgi:repressor LexA